MVTDSGVFIWKGLKTALVEALNKRALGVNQPKTGILYVYDTCVFDVSICAEIPITAIAIHNALGIKGESTLELANGSWLYTGGWTKGPRQSGGPQNQQQIPKEKPYPIPQWEEGINMTTGKREDE